MSEKMSRLRRRAEEDIPEVSKAAMYRNGGDGFILWAEKFLRIPVYNNESPIPTWTYIRDLSREPDKTTGRSFWDMWCNQKEVLRQALVMKNGRLKHRLIVFCWPRGEGKSAVACLIQLWKFFCFPQQQIMLGANSKDQVKFVHYDIMKNIILNSPELLEIVGKRNVQEKEIRLCDENGNPASMIRSISSFSGIVSNITGYSFSEMFDMKNPKFFVQLDGSTRNMPNALGVIDSTVSELTHILHKLYQTHKKGKDPSLFFHYRCSKDARQEDMWHPYNNQAQLDSYREKFPDVEFNRYFKNVWSAGSNRFFTDEMVQGTHYLGVDGSLGAHKEVISVLKNIRKIENPDTGEEDREEIDTLHSAALKRRLIRIEDVYDLKTNTLHPRMCTNDELTKLSELYNTDFAIMAGVDRADPMKADLTKGARTIVTIVAKGLPGSKNNPSMYVDEGQVKKYIYFLLHLVHVESNELDEIKSVLKSAIDEFDGLEMLCAERWGMWDVGTWCEEQEIGFETLQPSYDKQKEAFAEIFTLYKTGLFKTPTLRVPGSKNSDMLEEEALLFDHNPAKKWYGSPEKTEKGGVQDDAMFSLAWCLYGGRELGVPDFRERTNSMIFGEMFTEKTVGVY